MRIMKRTDGMISPARCLLISTMMLLTLAILSLLGHGEAVPPKKALSGFPKRIGEWIGKEGHFDQQVYDILGVDDSTLINYRGTQGRQIELYVGYYKSQRKGDLIHSPKNCLPGSGWNISRTSIESLIPVGGHPAHIKAIELILEKDDAKMVALYWFQSRGRFIASEYMQKVYLIWDAMTKNRTDGSFVRFTAPVGPKGVDYTIGYLKAFAERVVPILCRFLPGDKTVTPAASLSHQKASAL
jgi:EpsI family protein